MILLKKARVTQIICTRFLVQEVLVAVEGRLEKALSYLNLCGELSEGDEVLVNTTAVKLGLGSGGYHFVLCNLNQPELTQTGKGHIVKLRYTPLQSAFLSIEEKESPFHEVLANKESLDEMPVFIGSLHSQLPSVVLSYKKFFPSEKLVYIMTDGGALPLALSYSVAFFRDNNLLAATITAGQAFGGDFEAVNVASALVAARFALQADAAVVLMGPGIVGTGTKLGFSGLEQGGIANLVYALQGRPLLLPRLQFSDSRARHYGFSHHFLTVLKRILLFQPPLVLPQVDEEKKNHLLNQLEKEGLKDKFDCIFVDPPDLYDLFSSLPFKPSTMGRTYQEEPAFFQAAAAPVVYLAREKDEV